MKCINEDYLYDPIKNNKYFISETEYFDIVKEAEYGYLLKDKKGNIYYSGGQTIQGYVYKDYDAYNVGKGICYIPEFGFPEESDYISSKMVKEYTKLDINRAVKNELSQNYSDCFKSKKIPKKLIDNISKYVFDTVDWQSPETILDEMDLEEEIMIYFENNFKDLDCASKLLLEQIEEKRNIENEKELV